MQKLKNIAEEIAIAKNYPRWPESGVRIIETEIIAECCSVLEQRAKGYEARGNTIFNGKLIAEELRANIQKLQALGK